MRNAFMNRRSPGSRAASLLVLFVLLAGMLPTASFAGPIVDLAGQQRVGCFGQSYADDHRASGRLCIPEHCRVDIDGDRQRVGFGDVVRRGVDHRCLAT